MGGPARRAESQMDAETHGETDTWGRIEMEGPFRQEMEGRQKSKDT